MARQYDGLGSRCGIKVSNDARTVPMNCILHIEVVENRHLKNVALICLDQGPRLLAIDQIDLASKAICKLVSRVGDAKAVRCKGSQMRRQTDRETVLHCAA